MLEKLKLVVKKHGIIKVASDLGYKSTSTISYWFLNGKIPKVREAKVKAYLKGKK